MSVLLQISDTHFGTERPAVVEALLAFARDLAPTLVVLSGDITQRARPAQFAAARAFCDRLAAPLLTIPGNHDIALFDLVARLWQPYARYQRAFGPVLEPAYEDDDWLVLGVRTTRRWRHKHGQVSPQQVEQVAARLCRAGPAQMRVVVVHQPVAVPAPDQAHNLLRGHALALRRWAEAGADAVLGGHIHLPYVLPLHLHQAGLARRIWCVQAGTAVSSRVRREAGNSVNVLRHGHGDGSAAEVERWDYDGVQGRFARVARLVLDLDRGGPHG